MKYDVNQKINRFAKRTLLAFSEQLISLLEIKALEDITVNELCKECEYPRATFYNYFDDLYDLLNYCFDIISNEMNISNNQQASVIEIFICIYDYVAKEKDKVTRITRNNSIDGSLMEHLRKYMQKKAYDIMKTCPIINDHKIPFDMLVQHYSQTLMLILEWCFCQKKALTKEEAIQTIESLLGFLERS